MHHPNRRSFLTTAAGVAGAALAPVPAFAIDPFPRAGEPKLKLSLSAYSMRQHLRADAGSDRSLDMLGFVDYTAKQGLGAVEPTSYFFPDQVTDDYLAELKRRCHVNGLAVSGGAIRNNFTLPPGDELDRWFNHVDTWVAHYAKLGAPVIRVFAGNPPDGVSEDEAIERATANLERACENAGRQGVMLALENHDFLMDADRMVQIVEAVRSPWFGVNLDTGNFRSDDPYRDIARLAPYAVNVQVKVHLRIGDERREADFARIARLLRDAGYRGYLALEYEASEDPYDGIPRYLDKLREAVGD